jgi:glycosyltransferase involved in cell wall biosynthesis
MRVSVCMAAYNGEKFIAEQLKSILGQLGNNDEVIIVDDCSTDSTCQVIAAISDPRIQLIVHAVNRGVVASFEHAIQCAKGEFIFLSDQDDLWSEKKVQELLEVFRSDPEAIVVVSDARLIDQSGETIAESNFVDRKFRPGLLANLLHSRYIGCMMAFRSTLVPRILPFPHEFDVLHDIWIGTRNHVLGGKTVFIDRPLTYYRRHGANTTGVHRLTWRRRFRLRLDLLRALSNIRGKSPSTQPSLRRSS